jgi:hypothetical protein
MVLLISVVVKLVVKYVDYIRQGCGYRILMAD